MGGCYGCGAAVTSCKSSTSASLSEPGRSTPDSTVERYCAEVRPKLRRGAARFHSVLVLSSPDYRSQTSAKRIARPHSSNFRSPNNYNNTEGQYPTRFNDLSQCLGFL